MQLQISVDGRFVTAWWVALYLHDICIAEGGDTQKQTKGREAQGMDSVWLWQWQEGKGSKTKSFADVSWSLLVKFLTFNLWKSLFAATPKMVILLEMDIMRL